MSDSFSVTVDLDGSSHSFVCRADQTVLAAGEAAGVALPTSCGAGVCTTCAALIQSGSVHQSDAMGVRADLQEQGYALLCVSYPLSDLVIETEKEDEVYTRQFKQA